MTLPVSVVVVSRGRRDSLVLTLVGLSRLFYPNYEIVVVADAEGLEAVKLARMSDEVKAVAFADPNIAEARNRGIAVAAGEVIAFIDDDAIPEPTWLNNLVAPFADPQVSAVGGFVRGRNGISFQWKAHSVDHTGRATPLQIDETQSTVLTPPAGQAIKTEGTNMAFRRDVLAGIGGFDSAYRFYLDETDLNMRLAKTRRVTALAPLAEVHHAFAPSARRLASRAPKDLFEIGASLACYLRRHCPEPERSSVVERFCRERNDALIEHMVAGRLEPGDVRRLRQRLRDGIRAGETRSLTPLPALPHSKAPFLPFASRVKDRGTVVAGRVFARKRLRALARRKAKEGHSVSLFLFSPTALFHRVRMTRDGVWEQSGGLWGKSTRTDPWFALTGFQRRLKREKTRVAAVRGLPN